MLSLALVVSVTVLTLDYWAGAAKGVDAIGTTIRRELPPNARIVSVTSTVQPC